ncbi:4Fe-4S binding protein, partial [Pseudomonas aeruginosa]|uniref:4Fe-4S binding protein n=1 Tax=Pseudomonas aeruginosa TaxID=287 RepID=UPI001CA53286
EMSRGLGDVYKRQALAELDSQRCNGCGACLAPCPSQAIQLRALSTKESPRHA